ncbi:MAG: hypothetical protein WBG90_07435 [Saonia sp.]
MKKLIIITVLYIILSVTIMLAGFGLIMAQSEHAKAPQIKGVIENNTVNIPQQNLSARQQDDVTWR